MRLTLRHSTDNATLYVVTAYQFNHVDRPMSIDERFFDPALNAVFYFVDKNGAPDGFRGSHINEIDINPGIAEIGRTHIAEWTFLLTEYHRPFARYPFFMVSSRFHEKNLRLAHGLAPIWQDAIKALRRYGWGYLPSYDRDAGFEDLLDYREKDFLAMSDRGLDFVEAFYQVRFPTGYRYFSDFFCNYIGFASRKHFERYLDFYLPFLGEFFDRDYNIRVDGNDFCRRLNAYRNEKPFTFLIEMISHLFFYKNRLPFAGVTYDGIYEVRERDAVMRRVSRLDLLPRINRLGRLLPTQRRMITTPRPVTR